MHLSSADLALFFVFCTTALGAPKYSTSKKNDLLMPSAGVDYWSGQVTILWPPTYSSLNTPVPTTDRIHATITAISPNPPIANPPDPEATSVTVTLPCGMGTGHLCIKEKRNKDKTGAAPEATITATASAGESIRESFAPRSTNGGF